MSISLITFAQYDALKPVDIIKSVDEKVEFRKLSLFNQVTQSSFVETETNARVEGFEFTVNSNELNSLTQEKSKFIEVDIPFEGRILTTKLAEVDLYQGANFIYSEPGMKKTIIDPGKHYRGIVKELDNTFVALSFFENEISGLISGVSNKDNIVIGKKKNSNTHVIYRDEINSVDELACGTEDDGVEYRIEQIEYEPNVSSLLNNCVRLYMEVNYDVYRSHGSEQSVTSFVTGFMNQVAAVYANENIKVLLNPITVWTQPSPYSGNSTVDMMQSFQRYRTDFDGDLGMLIGYTSNGGVAAGFSGLCNPYRSNSQSYSSIARSYDIWPRYSWAVDLVSHEYGHLFGSRHTHACVWNGNGTAIDSCSGFTEGNCSLPGIPPSGKGTIMSYCHQNVGKDFRYGFGEQPGNVIRWNVENKSCLTSCDNNPTDPDPEPDPTDCFVNDFNVEIVFDKYPSETSWEIRDANGNVVVSDGPFNDQLPYSTYNETVSLEAGEYTFKILDSYGDGICCYYGDGTFSFTDGEGADIVSDKAFRNYYYQTFCVEDNEPDVDTTPPSSPENLRVYNIRSNQVTIAWDASTDNVGVVGYNIYFSGTKIGTVTNTSTPITYMRPNTRYSCYVTAIDEAGNESGRSNIIDFRTSYYSYNATDENSDIAMTEGVSLGEQIEVGTLTVYPNPVTVGEDVKFVLPTNIESGSIEIFNLAGILVQSVNYDQNVVLVSTHGLVPGVYVAKVVSKDGETLFDKFIVK